MRSRRAGQAEGEPTPATRYPRHGGAGDFERVVFFTDAVFAIAMTLLVVEIGVPERVAGDADDPGALLDALGDKVPLVIAFFIGCYVIGSYWVAHHRLMSWLVAVDRGFVALTVVYLSFVALLPDQPRQATAPVPGGMAGRRLPVVPARLAVAGAAVRRLDAGRLRRPLAGDRALVPGHPPWGAP